MAIILTQRDILPFHGSAFEKDGKCIIFTGGSGAGKSTILRHFISLGFKAVSDDVCAIRLKNGIPMVIPSYPGSKMWSDTMDWYKIKKSEDKKVRPCIEKYSCSFRDAFYSSELPLGSIFILKQKNNYDFEVEDYKGFKKIEKLKANLYRPKFPKLVGKEKQTFIILQAMAMFSKVYCISRSNAIEYLSEFNQFAEDFILRDVTK